MGSVLGEIYRRSPVLAVTGGLHALLFVVAAVASVFDDRTVLGIDPWIKPMKFMASIAIYLWTVAWLLEPVRRPRWIAICIAWGVALSMIVETGCLWVQSARGTRSHFNFESPFDGAVFALMGLMILLNTILMDVLLLRYLWRPAGLSRTYTWGVRIGLVVFLLGSWIGLQMILRGGHAVGVADGGPGLPFVNWSTVGGDLRIGHALGLHGLQVFPLLGWWLGTRRFAQPHVSLVLLAAAGAAYVTVLLLALAQATAGRPLVPM